MGRPVFDLHCDTLSTPWAGETGRIPLNHPQSAFSLGKIPPQTRWAQCCAAFLPDELSPTQAMERFQLLRRRFEQSVRELRGCALPCVSGSDIRRAWGQGKSALLLTVENGSLLGRELENVELLSQAGVVLLTLTWNGENPIGSGHATDKGLTLFGKALIPELERRGIVVDVSHLNDRGFWDVMDLAHRPPVASHSNARACCPHPRNLSDDQIRELIAREGLIGLNFHAPFLREGGTCTGMEDLYRHIAHFLELGAGDILALGSDWDGSAPPPSLSSCRCVEPLADYLLSRGLTKEWLEKLLWKNAQAFFLKNRP